MRYLISVLISIGKPPTVIELIEHLLLHCVFLFEWRQERRKKVKVPFIIRLSSAICAWKMKVDFITEAIFANFSFRHFFTSNDKSQPLNDAWLILANLTLSSAFIKHCPSFSLSKNWSYSGAASKSIHSYFRYKITVPSLFFMSLQSLYFSKANQL